MNWLSCFILHAFSKQKGNAACKNGIAESRWSTSAVLACFAPLGHTFILAPTMIAHLLYFIFYQITAIHLFFSTFVSVCFKDEDM